MNAYILLKMKNLVVEVPGEEKKTDTTLMINWSVRNVALNYTDRKIA